MGGEEGREGGEEEEGEGEIEKKKIFIQYF